MPRSSRLIVPGYPHHIIQRGHNRQAVLVSDSEDVSSLGKLMKRLAGRQTRYVNKLEKRTGSLWEGRYRSSPISMDNYLLACSRYIELNPVWAGIVASPAEYRWSSYSEKSGQSEPSLIDFDPCYLGLSVDPKKRGEVYAGWISDD